MLRLHAISTLIAGRDHRSGFDVMQFSEGFEHFIPPDQSIIAEGITTGLVVLDSNVLLGAYRFAPKSREELLDALALLGDRIWIPNQVGLEFHRNRLSVIAENDAAYRDAIETIENRSREALPELEKKVRELSNRVALGTEERQGLLSVIASTFSELSGKLEHLRETHGVGTLKGPDKILERISDIFSGRIGAPPSDEENEADRNEAKVRIEKQAPPGYKDSNKDDPRGDYLVWSQTLREAARRKSTVLVFVTNDTKEDWYTRMKGQAIMARPELALECLQKSSARLVMLPTQQFLSNARSLLAAPISDETIRQANQGRLANERLSEEILARKLAALIQDAQEARIEVENRENARAIWQSQADQARFRHDEATERLANIAASQITEDETSRGRLSIARAKVHSRQIELENSNNGLDAISLQLNELKDRLARSVAMRAKVERDLNDLRSRL